MQRLVIALYFNNTISKLLGNSSFDSRILRRNAQLSVVITLVFLTYAATLVSFTASTEVFNTFRLVASIALASFLACITIVGKFHYLRIIGTDAADSVKE